MPAVVTDKKCKIEGEKNDPMPFLFYKSEKKTP
jgi:hypothetical protein